MEMPDVLTLSSREQVILSLVGSGHSAHEIAGMLEITPGAVENHKRRIYHKMGVVSQSQAVSKGLGLGLLDAPRGEKTRSAGPPGPEQVVVHARLRAGRDEVVRALIRGGLPLVVLRDLALDHEYSEWWRRGRFTVVLVDPAPDDWQLPVRLRASFIVVPSAPPQQAMVMNAMKHGAYAMVWLADVSDHLCATLGLVSKGYIVVQGKHLDWEIFERSQHVPQLSRRERDILDSIAAGNTMRQTARVLGISIKTVENTQARLFRKLGARNRSEALTNAHRGGLLSLEPGQEPVTDPRP